MPVAELMTKRLLAAGNLVLTRGRLFRDVPEKLVALAQFARDEAIDVALSSGDFTALGTEAEYVAARSAVAPFFELPLGFCAVPGNHDLYLADAVRDSRFERHFAEAQRSDLPELAVDGAFPYVRLLGEELAVVCVNSARPNPNPFSSAGEVPQAQLDALARALAHSAIAQRWVFVMTHYGILRQDGTPDSAHHGLGNADALLQICTRPRVSLLHGHIHHRFHHAPSASHPWLFCAGSTTHRGREGLWVYEFEADRVRAIPGLWAHGRYNLEHSQSVVLS